MPQIHYLNVKNGDCSWIKHGDGKITVIDVNNAFSSDKTQKVLELTRLKKRLGLREFLKMISNQKSYPVNPVDYLKSHSVNSVFRFILTHPDMDHMDGIEDFFKEFKPQNFWDTANTKQLSDFSSGLYNESDWDFYTKMRDKKTEQNRLVLYDGSQGKYYNDDDSGGGGSGLQILAPTKSLIEQANKSEDWNDSSYVILYSTGKRKILFCGDADEHTWTHLLEKHLTNIKDIDLLIAPHHGRKSSCSYDFLEQLNPKMTFFGNADKATHLATDMFTKLKLDYITNNQGSCLIADINESKIDIHVTSKSYALSQNPQSTLNPKTKGYFVKSI